MAVAVEEHHQGNSGDGIVLCLFCTQIMKLHRATHIHMHAHTHGCVHAMSMKSERALQIMLMSILGLHIGL